MKSNIYILPLLIPIGIWMGSPGLNESTHASFSSSTPPVSNQCDIENSCFGAGEEIVYKIYYNWNFVWLSAGEVSFKVVEKPDSYHIAAKGQTYPSYEWFYRVNDNYQSWVDKETLLPKVFIREVEEGKYRQYNKFLFDHSRKKVTTYVGKEKETAVKKEVPIRQCMHDMLSILYYVRNMDIEAYREGSSFPIDVFLEDSHPLNVHVLKKNEKQRIRGMGKFDTHLIAPDLVSGHIFEEGTKMKVWVSADKNRLPLLIESPVSVGSIKAVLKEYKGLKHELSSKQ